MLTGSLPPISRRSTYIETLELIDDDTGDPIDLTGATVTVRVMSPGLHCDYGFLAPWTLNAALDSGVTVPEDGVIVWRFEAGTVGRLSLGIATLSVLISRDGDTDEVARLSLPIED